MRAAIACPIVVRGRTWGALVRGGTRPSRSHRRPRCASRGCGARCHGRRERRYARGGEAAGRRAGRVATGRNARRARVAGRRRVRAVAAEMAQLLRVEDTTICSATTDDWTATVVADRGDRDVPSPIGTRMSLEGESATALVRRTGRAARWTTSRAPPGRSPSTRATRASARPSVARSWSTVGSGAP